MGAVGCALAAIGSGMNAMNGEHPVAAGTIAVLGLIAFLAASAQYLRLRQGDRDA